MSTPDLVVGLANGVVAGSAVAALAVRKHYLALLTEREQRSAEVLREKEHAFEEQLRLLRETEDRLAPAFEQLSTKALREAKNDFLQLAETAIQKTKETSEAEFELKQRAIERLLDPMKESLKRLTEHSAELETKRVGAYEVLTAQVQLLAREADQLSSALRKPQVRGCWGELVLKQICENAGLIEGEHYVLQDTSEADGKELRPDLVFKLPRGRVVVVDSKCPLESFRESLAAEDEPMRELKLKAHARHVRNHVKALSAKSYWSRYSGSPDCVVLFIPSESAYAAALQADPALIEDAAAARVLLANPSTIAALVRTIAHVFADERLRENALEVREVGRKLYDSLRGFANHLVKHGRHLRLATESYNDAAKAFGATLVPRAQKLSELGSATGAELEEPMPIESSIRDIDERHTKALAAPGKNGRPRKNSKIV